jgi:hypothetical protein
MRHNPSSAHWRGFLSAWCIAGVALLVLYPNPADAANVVWTPPVTVSAATDVSAIGTLLEAANTGIDQNSVPTTVAVNGVTFTGWGIAGAGSFVSPGGHFTMSVAAGHFQQSFDGFGSTSAPFSALPANYRTLLAGGNFAQNQTNANDFTGTLTLAISGLTINNQYQFQWWTNDSRPFSTGPVTATAGTSVSLDPNTTDGAGGVGQYAIGTFTADATMQNIVFTTTGNANLQNAFQVRLVPEPAGVLTLFAAGSMLATLRRRRDVRP